jgi:lipoprotein NlpD
VIIKHGEDFLSAYAHNRVLHVAEGDKVSSGNKIAEIGYSGAADEAKLHFEIRVRGKPVDPLKYLPSQ